jgi:hypothetical protein
VTTIDNGTWASITFYYVEQFGRESTMCALLYVNEGATANNLTKVIIKAVRDLISMSCDDIAMTMMAFGAGKLHITGPFG